MADKGEFVLILLWVVIVLGIIALCAYVPVAKDFVNAGVALNLVCVDNGFNELTDRSDTVFSYRASGSVSIECDDLHIINDIDCEKFHNMTCIKWDKWDDCIRYEGNPYFVCKLKNII